MVDAPVHERIVQEKRQRLFGGQAIGRLVQRHRSVEHGRDHHGIPTGQNIAVTQWFDPSLSRRQQFLPGRFQCRFSCLLFFGGEASPSQAGVARSSLRNSPQS